MRAGAAVLLAGSLIGCATAGGDRPIEISVYSGSNGPPPRAVERTLTHDDQALYGPVGAAEPCGAVAPDRARELRRLAQSDEIRNALSDLASRPHGPARLSDVTFLVGSREAIVPAGSAPGALLPLASKIDETFAKACGSRYADPLVRAMTAAPPSGGGARPPP